MDSTVWYPRRRQRTVTTSITYHWHHMTTNGHQHHNSCRDQPNTTATPLLPPSRILTRLPPPLQAQMTLDQQQRQQPMSINGAQTMTDGSSFGTQFTYLIYIGFLSPVQKTWKDWRLDRIRTGKDRDRRSRS